MFVVSGARWVPAVVCVAALAEAGCQGDIHKDIHGNIHVVVNRTDSFVPKAAHELQRYGLRALPQIETALHSAKPDARLRLVQVLLGIPQADTAALLRHLALFDADERVRDLSEHTIAVWGAKDPALPLTTASRSALAWLRQSRAKGLGPTIRTVDP